METEVLAKRLRMTADHYYSRECGPTYDLLNESADRLQELTPKYDESIPVHAEELRDLAVRVGRIFNHRCEAVILAAADRIERMNGPKPKPSVADLLCELDRIAENTKADESNRAKLEAAIKALKGE